MLMPRRAMSERTSGSLRSSFGMCSPPPYVGLSELIVVRHLPEEILHFLQFQYELLAQLACLSSFALQIPARLYVGIQPYLNQFTFVHAKRERSAIIRRSRRDALPQVQ